MTLWIILTLMIAVTVSGITIPLVRRYDLRAERGTTLGVLRGQLADVDVQVANGVVSETEAEGLRTEIKRRMLAEARSDEGTPRPLKATTMPWLSFALVVLVALGATGIYATMGRPDLTDASGVPAAPSPAAQAAATPPAQGAAQGDANNPAHPMGDVASMVAGLEAKLQQTPNDPQGWQMLGWSYMRMARFADAAKAYDHAAKLQPNNTEYLSAEGEAVVNANGEKITPDAVALFQKVVTVDPTDPRARYYLAAFKDQQGDHVGAINDWITLLKSAPPDAPWAPQVRSFIEKTATANKVDITGKLPPAPPPPAPDANPMGANTLGGAMPPPAANTPGPTPDQVAAASQMSDADRQAMVHTMVDRLAAELKENPKNADGWMRLMRARMVLGDKDAAASAYQEANKAFNGDGATQTQIRDTARSLGIPGA